MPCASVVIPIHQRADILALCPAALRGDRLVEIAEERFSIAATVRGVAR